MTGYRPYVFQGGPLDGLEIRAVARTAVYRDAAGDPLPVGTGDRRSGALLHVARPRRRGGLYVAAERPARVPEAGRIVQRPGRYRWMPPAR
ncbi:hypothetical protein ACQP2P_01430 [Dactylosporangium sp. CA-139114]|uniref:hypothetical protein n=1 Tax=Dactylosporangium sp. CA-139114 TaxID=3239931 RepID=UPI003D9553E8